MKAVGEGTRGEPLLASLLSSACCLLASLKNNEWDLTKAECDESFWINGLGTLVNLIYLCLFLIHADRNNAWWTMILVWVPTACFYFGFTLFAVVSEYVAAVQWLCTLAVAAAWCIPLGMAFFVVR
jgi:hypothetical protein